MEILRLVIIEHFQYFYFTLIFSLVAENKIAVPG